MTISPITAINVVDIFVHILMMMINIERTSKQIGDDVNHPSLHFIDSQEAFQYAIDKDELSVKPDSPIFAGHFMYMHSDDKGHTFKHRDTRRSFIVPTS